MHVEHDHRQKPSSALREQTVAQLSGLSRGERAFPSLSEGAPTSPCRPVFWGTKFAPTLFRWGRGGAGEGRTQRRGGSSKVGGEKSLQEDEGTGRRKGRRRFAACGEVDLEPGDQFARNRSRGEPESLFLARGGFGCFPGGLRVPEGVGNHAATEEEREEHSEEAAGGPWLLVYRRPSPAVRKLPCFTRSLDGTSSRVRIPAANYTRLIFLSS